MTPNKYTCTAKPGRSTLRASMQSEIRAVAETESVVEIIIRVHCPWHCTQSHGLVEKGLDYRAVYRILRPLTSDLAEVL